jgi:uncharacterized membrane protein SpoIIM required for sporulation
MNDAQQQLADLEWGDRRSRFVREKEPGWRRLSELLDRVRVRGVSGLDGSELLELGKLYRRAAADLTYVRTHLADDVLAARLNQLVARAHGVVYVSESSGWLSVPRFFWREFPEVLWHSRYHVLVVTAVFAGSFLLAYFAARWSTPFGASLPPEDYLLPMDRGEDGFQPGAMVSSFITTNNVGVALRAFAGGVTAGVFTLVVIFSNGLMMGKVSAIMADKGQSFRFWAAILPHGVLELTAIMIAGGAGLVMGWALVAPGDLTRRKALARGGGTAVRLVLGTVPMFVVAGIIEGFVSFTDISNGMKLAVAAMTAVMMAAYVRRKPTRE